MEATSPRPERAVLVGVCRDARQRSFEKESLRELEELAAVARRFGVILLSDEIYGQLHHQGAHVSVARFYPEGTIISSGLSKWCGAGGWRLGTFTFPGELRWLLDAMASVASETYTSTCAPIQYAASSQVEPCCQMYMMSVVAPAMRSTAPGASGTAL